jgi:3-hydroxybutyryl-CoA dehydratase
MVRELRVGDVLPETRFPVETGPMKVFSLIMADPNPIHFDAAFVASIGRGDRTINQGTLNIAYVFNAVITWLDDPAAVARIRSFTCRFGGSVYAGDEVTVGGEVTAVDETGTATLSLWLDRAGSDRALAGTAVIAAAC